MMPCTGSPSRLLTGLVDGPLSAAEEKQASGCGVGGNELFQQLKADAVAVGIATLPARWFSEQLAARASGDQGR